MARTIKNVLLANLGNFIYCLWRIKREKGKKGKPAPRVIKVSTKFVDDEQTAKSLVKVVEAVNRRSNGTLELQLFTSGTLPIGKDGMEQVVNGSDWIFVDGVNFLGDYIPDYNAVTGPLSPSFLRRIFKNG